MSRKYQILRKNLHFQGKNLRFLLKNDFILCQKKRTHPPPQCRAPPERSPPASGAPYLRKLNIELNVIELNEPKQTKQINHHHSLLQKLIVVQSKIMGVLKAAPLYPLLFCRVVAAVMLNIHVKISFLAIKSIIFSIKFHHFWVICTEFGSYFDAPGSF